MYYTRKAKMFFADFFFCVLSREPNNASDDGCSGGTKVFPEIPIEHKNNNIIYR